MNAIMNWRGRRPQGSLPVIHSSPASTMTTAVSERAFIVEAGEDVGLGGDPCARLSPYYGIHSPVYIVTLIYKSTILLAQFPTICYTPIHREKLKFIYTKECARDRLCFTIIQKYSLRRVMAAMAPFTFAVKNSDRKSVV